MNAMPLTRHLLELRQRLLRSVIAIVLVFIPLFMFAGEIYTHLAQPLMQALPEGGSMIATDVTAPFLVPFKLALYLSMLLAMPFLLHQCWSFVSPGLYRREKRFARPLLFASVLLFYLGALFAWFVVMPLLFAFFISVAPEGVAVMTDIGAWLGFTMTFVMAFGMAFELPVAVVLLVASGITTPAALSAARAYVVVGCFVAGMLLTPPDIISQSLLAIPMWGLFEAGLLCSRWVQPLAEDSEALT
ncbi:twin-arginine protein translocation system subunit TatC [Alcanivorax sp. HI0033]|jgi:sec-independent protein translocase protein TatC|uniref:twin-arginine translocase subunit TatC n=1 Tax=unclassified Alcanivorax TaxID=2638842 RepID=UPI0007B92E60|nr:MULTISPECIES: twin-arginine translocase subunit TatC [unclassified Alcanivorax]KZX80219.1 twin-arginine protein translocation system subunit TatC [Alcanivorax sp. HI0013]KZX85813.1 twin-arginine protein translocation system subunit TatC [Alcanivorax sp. HI0011]KZY11713.1 twin-arginine protein translocation system subunit TatC [Alcanivorax sp. HI0035]KZX60994.1 twin-arginine protein translocation system subunit TatC [Alcanivorax sp. HI0003]KZX66890.1 twin-arginine protein translocation syste